MTSVLVVGLGVAAARLLADRGYRAAWPPRHAAPAAANGPGAPRAPPFPAGPSTEDAAQREMASCASPPSSAEVRIEPCTVAIASGWLSEVNRAIAFCDRGAGHDTKREAALATADLDEALRSAPGDAEAWRLRG